MGKFRRQRGIIILNLVLFGAVAALALSVGWKFLPSAGAQGAAIDLPTPANPIVAKILDPSGNITDFQPLITVANNQLHVSIPEPKVSFRPGKYKLELWIWQSGAIYFTENDFTWGVLAVNFNKSIYNSGDKAKIGFAVLDDRGHTVCNADVNMEIAAPSGRVSRFSTEDKTIKKSATCGPGTVTNNPDYSAFFQVDEPGRYAVYVSVTTVNGTRQISDGFEVQNPPMFDVERFAPTRIFPPATYGVSIRVKANADFAGNITETAPASFNISAGGGAQKSFTHDIQTISWPVNLKQGDSTTLSYSFKAPDVSPELYKLGPLQIGNWAEARQWQIAADAVANTVIFVTSTASTTWTVPSDWSASNTIEVVGGGGGGATNNGTGGSANRGGAAGGGGAYAKITNFTTSTGNSINILVGPGGAAQATGTITFFNWSGGGSTSTCSGTTMQLCAMGGNNAVNGNPSTFGSGGASSTSVGTVKHGGGAGGADASSKNAGAGGGGAGGLNGEGNIGLDTTTGTGGSGDAGLGGAGGATAAGPGGTGGAGAEWTSNPGGVSGGSGGGGGGSTGNGSTGGIGGNYGGGGAGGKSGGGSGGAGQQGIIVITYTPATITLANGSQQASSTTIGPGGTGATSTVFTFKTEVGTSTITNVTTTVSTSTGVYQIQIQNSGGTTVYGSSTNPTATSTSISLSSMNVSTTATTFRIFIVPLNATSMPTTPVSGSGVVGGLYTVTSTITAWTDSNSEKQAGSNTTSSIITIDNDSPADVTNVSGTSGNAQVQFSWTNPSDTDFATTTLVRTTSTSGVTWRPGEGTYYATGTVSGAATNTIACVVASSTANCTDTGLTNGTTYNYMIFTADNFLNYSSGTVPTGNPFTPSANSPPSVSAVTLNHGNSLTLTPNATTSFDLNWSVSDPNGCSDINTNKATSTAFRFGVRSTCAVPSPTTSNLSCYLYLTRATSSCSGTTINVTDTVGIYYFADSTGNASATYGTTDHWEAYALANDAAGATSSATSSNVDVGVLSAVNVTTSSINYGTVVASSTSAEQEATTTNAGNSTTSLQLYALATLSTGTLSIATGSQHYGTSTGFAFGTSTALTDTAVTVTGLTLVTPTSTTNVSKLTSWLLNVPAGTLSDIYSGTNVFSPLWAP